VSALAPASLTTVADILDHAQQSATDVVDPPGGVELSVAEAYAVQTELINRRLSRGEAITGVKLGFTSKAKMRQMGVSDVIVGRLTDGMRIPDDGEVHRAVLVHPKVEPEIAFRLARDVDTADPAADIEGAVDAVAAAIEVIDSRYRDFRFTYPGVIADNTSAAGYAVGPWHPMTDVANRAVRLIAPGGIEIGSTAAILGHPIRALYALLSMCRQHRIELRKGYVVLAGAATAAIALTEGVVRCDVTGVGSVQLKGLP
jgi:2-oxo-3-hexenedioate decarboxylase